MRTLEDLLETLVSATEGGKLLWESQGKQHYVAELPRYKISVSYWTDEDDGISGITTRLLNKNDELLDVVRANEYSPKYPSLERIFDAARRSANRIDQIISDVETQLESLKPRRG
jgi:hypothetical protein